VLNEWVVVNFVQKNVMTSIYFLKEKLKTRNSFFDFVPGAVVLYSSPLGYLQQVVV